MYLGKKFSSISPSATLAIDSKFKAMKAEGMDVVGFGAGEPDFPTPRHIKDAAIYAIENNMTTYTPASGTLDVKKAVCEKFMRENGLEYKPENIVVSNGAKHSLNNALGAILNPGDEVIIPAPCWVSYPEMVLLADGVPVIVDSTEEEGFLPTIEKIRAAVTDKTRAIIINNPSNPTGMCYTEDVLRQIAALCVEKNIYIIADEIYESLVYDNKKNFSIATISDEVKELTIIVNGVSKTYAMTGWRIGYTASNARLAKVMGNVQSHATSNPNSIAQYATIAALTGTQEPVAEMKKAFEERRNHMVKRMNAIDGVSCIMPDGAFYIMMNISGILGKKIDGVEITGSDVFAEKFLEVEKVAVVPGKSFGTDIHLRWSYATSMENIDKGIDRLESFISKLN
ncbi:MAG: pyridoxal phosphate-dependent aminotransferase [Clostridia bacterium]|nr:pyridoxal phosphate-dependent aminotransferase [Clostridia bacterium]